MRWYIIILFQFVLTTSISMGLEIQKGDSVYFQIDGYEIVKPNFKLKPYFKMYRKTETNWEKVSETRSFDGNQQDEIPNVQKYFLNMTKDDSIYRIDVRSDWDNSFVAVGREIKIQDVLDCAENGNLFVISNENSSENKNSLKLQRLLHDGNNFKIGIAKYNILHFDNSFIQNLEKNFPISIFVQDGEQKIGDFPTESGALKQNLSSKPEVLLKLEDGKVFMFGLKNKMGDIVRINMPAEKIFQQLSDVIKKNPDNFKEWKITITSQYGNKIFLSFAGIQRLYRLDSVDIPQTNPRQDGYKGSVYKLQIGVLHNEKTCNKAGKDYITAKELSWSPTSFPDHNLFEIREGIDWKYSIRLKAKNNLVGLRVKGDNFNKPIRSADRPEYPEDEMTIKFSLEK